MVVAVNRGTARLCTNAVELIAECRHIRGIVFIARDDLVNGVDNDRLQFLIPDPPYHLRHQLIQRHGVASQVPEQNIVHVVGRNAESLIDLEKAVHGAGRVDLQIDIQHTTLFAVESEPWSALGYSDGKFHEEKTLSCF